MHLVQQQIDNEKRFEEIIQKLLKGKKPFIKGTKAIMKGENRGR